MTSDFTHSGSCLCGAVRVTAQTANSIDACHCTMCRKWGGGPLLAVECGEAVRFEGEEHIATFSSSDWAERGFCRICGTHLFYRLKQEQHYELPVGLFGDEAQWVFATQIFIDEKPAYYDFAQATKKLTGEQVFAQFSGQ